MCLCKTKMDDDGRAGCEASTEVCRARATIPQFYKPDTIPTRCLKMRRMFWVMTVIVVVTCHGQRGHVATEQIGATKNAN